ncbi:11942_t:CDS:1, partial [Racocetra persica]
SYMSRDIIKYQVDLIKIVSIDYIGACWIVILTRFNTIQPKYDLTNIANCNKSDRNNKFATRFISFTNQSIYNISTNQEKILAKSTANLFKDIKTISNRVEYIKINNSFDLFIKELNDKYFLSQKDIEDPLR